MNVTVTVNGQQRSGDVEPRMLLVHFIRDVLGLTGTHVGCDTSQCGACTIIMNGKAVKSCTLLAVQATGAEITTIEGLATDGQLHPIQEGFWEEHGLQCGYCTPGMMMTAYDLLARNQNPSEQEIRHAIHGNLCRCTGYEHIVNAIQYAARKGGAPQEAVPEPVPAATREEVDRAAVLAGGSAEAGPRPDQGPPTPEALETYYDDIARQYPSVSREELEQAKAHPQGHFEGIVGAIGQRTGERVDSVRERLRGLLKRA